MLAADTNIHALADILYDRGLANARTGRGYYLFLLSALIIALSIPLLRIDLSTPLNEPIRFNRARQKIYAYNFKPHWTAPFSPWPIETAVYDWSQVRAEFFYYSSGSNHQYGITLSIVKPGTNEVIDRFRMTYNNASEDPWLYIHTYMEKGPEALPLRPPTRPERTRLVQPPPPLGAEGEVARGHRP
ncbi:DUF6708 domain-containing protein [Pseudomonas sp. KNUC1026]|uniref:DUF6708 domain-containing protein n=1 Tax=Pseudomonas sp. KNUC1026 TaxID=2893890 RepID=UPI001F3A732E|nr:DUF6708 domain-containing protein [Pseudomonas sp. KNUC1026]UFH49889.1 hypothetical protein LN139_00340 [Pseudomonas sp. KNUC1026]